MKLSQNLAKRSKIQFGRNRLIKRLKSKRLKKSLFIYYIQKKRKLRAIKKMWISKFKIALLKYNVGYSAFIRRMRANNVEYDPKEYYILSKYEPFSFHCIMLCLKLV